jgi:hypothetical protein
MFTVNAGEIQTQIEQSIVKPLGELNEASRAALIDVLLQLEDQVVTRARALASGEVLQVRSGRFVGSIQGDVTESATGVIADVYSRDPKAGILEYGGHIPPHEIDPNTAHALRFLGRAGGATFAARVHSPGATIAPHPTIDAAYDEMRSRIYQDINNNVNVLIYQHMAGWQVALGLTGASAV